MKIFDTSIDMKTRQFYIFAVSAMVGNITGFLANAALFGFCRPTRFCGICALLVVICSLVGCFTKYRRIPTYILIVLLVFIEFPAMYWWYGSCTLVYLILGIVAIAAFVPSINVVFVATLTVLYDLFVIFMRYLTPAVEEELTRQALLSASVSSYMIVAFCVFLVVMLLIMQQEKQAEELRNLTEKLRDAAEHDDLTGLYNRRYLNEYLTNLQKGPKSGFCAVLIDLDLFKQINDEYGHGYGDQVLVAFSRILEKNVEGHGIATRFGGEEFMLILTETLEEEIQRILYKIRDDYKAYAVSEKGKEFSFSCGVELCENTMDTSEIYHIVDKKLYKAKNNGRNCMQF